MSQNKRLFLSKVQIIMMLLVAVLLCSGCFAEAAVKKPAQVKNVKVTASGKTKHKVKWKKIKGVTGYQVYCRDYSSSNKLFKKVKTVKGASKTSCTIKSRKAGKAYAYVVRAYKKVGKKTYYGKLSAYAYGYIKNPTVAGGTLGNTNSSSNVSSVQHTL